MFLLYFFVGTCVVSLFWLLLTPSGRIFANKANSYIKEQELQRQKGHNTAKNWKATKKPMRSESTSKTLRKTVKNINWLLSLFSPKAQEKINRKMPMGIKKR